MNWEWFGNTLGAIIGTVSGLAFFVLAVGACFVMFWLARLLAEMTRAVARWRLRDERVSYYYDPRDMAHVIEFRDPKPFRVTLARKKHAAPLPKAVLNDIMDMQKKGRR